MPKTHHVIYIPGIGDANGGGQILALKFWKIYGLRARYHKVGWADDEAFEPKLDRLLAQIDELTEVGNRVSLVGVSAGASLAIQAFAMRKDKLNKMVLLCGKVQNPQTIWYQTYERNPAFKESMAKVPQSLKVLLPKDLSRICSIHTLHDNIVPPKDTLVPGASAKLFPVAGHVFGIAFGITLGSPIIARFLKR